MVKKQVEKQWIGTYPTMKSKGMRFLQKEIKSLMLNRKDQEKQGMLLERKIKKEVNYD